MPLPLPVLVYDGKCAFCLRCVERAKFLIGDRIDYAPYQQAASLFPQVHPAAFAQAVHFIEPDGKITRGAAAVIRALQFSGRYRALATAYDYVPGFAPLAEFAYHVVSENRPLADRLDMLLIGRDPRPSTYRLTRQIFLRLLGVVFLIAFWSLRVQVDGLMGSDGILPVRNLLDAVRRILGEPSYRYFPTLCWLDPSDAFLHGLCAVGIVAAVLIILGLFQRVSLIVACACYLSLCVAGQDFLGFQWDYLLMEAGFLAIFFAPMHPLAWRARSEPSRVMLWMLRWLLFRLMFMSGVVKWTSNDPAWRSLTALRYHYLTQPLPNWISWYFYHLPARFQTFSCGVVFFAELVCPFLIFMPHRPRILGFWGLLAFQILIILTGNYGFFNVLTIALCCLLPDDHFWRWILRVKTSPKMSFPPVRWRAIINVPIALVLLAITIPICIGAFNDEMEFPRWIVWLQENAEPFRIANGYGLFRVMTTDYKAIVLEGSDDGTNWKAYSFKFTPGDVHRRPEMIAPYMPRLDWQMWFASLGDESQNPWFTMFMRRILEGSPAVLGLMDDNPFPDQPPRFLRAILYRYEFTDFTTRRETGDWWKRSEIGIYAEESNPY